MLEDALTAIDANPMFNNMVGEVPRPISSTTTETNFQSAFDRSNYWHAIKSGTYTAGCNLFWADTQWSATPLGPLRLAAVKTLAKNLFAEPTP